MSRDVGPVGPTDPRITDTRRGRPNHGLTGFVAPRRPTFLLRNPLLTALQESVGGLGFSLVQIRCRRSQPRCFLIRPQRQSCHHMYRRQQPRHNHNPLHMSVPFNNASAIMTYRPQYCASAQGAAPRRNPSGMHTVHAPMHNIGAIIFFSYLISVAAAENNTRVG